MLRVRIKPLRIRSNCSQSAFTIFQAHRTERAQPTLFHGDNLKFLRAMNSESVDLIATDPPFKNGRDFHATPDSLAKGARFQYRWSWKRGVHQEWVDQPIDDHPRLMEAIESARYAHSDSMDASLCFMAGAFADYAQSAEAYRQHKSALRPDGLALPESGDRRSVWAEELSE